MAGRAGTQTAPASVAEGLGNALRELVSAMTAPDAIKVAAPLVKLQSEMLDLYHRLSGVPAAGTPGEAGAGGAHPPGAPGAPGAPGMPAQPPGLSLMPGGLGPSAAAQPSGQTADTIRRLVAEQAAG